MSMAENKTKPTDAGVDDYIADLDRSALEKLVVGSVADVRRRYG